jgi:hypothetical protein
MFETICEHSRSSEFLGGDRSAYARHHSGERVEHQFHNISQRVWGLSQVVARPNHSSLLLFPSPPVSDQAVPRRRVAPVLLQRIFLAKCLRIFKAVESQELNPAHLLSNLKLRPRNSHNPMASASNYFCQTLTQLYVRSRRSALLPSFDSEECHNPRSQRKANTSKYARGQIKYTKAKLSSPKSIFRPYFTRASAKISEPILSRVSRVAFPRRCVAISDQHGVTVKVECPF